MSRLGSHPLAIPGLALLFGLVTAGLLSTFIPPSESASFELPAWLAERLSESGDRTAVLGRPRALWLMPAALLPFLVFMARKSLVDVPGYQIAAQVLVRLGVLMALALALSLPTLRAPIRGKTIVFVVDVSESIDDAQLEGAQNLVAEAMRAAASEEAAGIAREDRARVRLVTYSGRAQAIDVAGLDPAALELERDPEHALASDHAAGLRLAQALLDPDTEGRMVLITDGTGSLAERESLAIATYELEKRGIHRAHPQLSRPGAR